MTIGSRSSSRIAAGATPVRIASASAALPELDPRLAGIISTRPATLAFSCGCQRSMMRPVVGSRPPQKLSGSSSRSGAPDASPGESIDRADEAPHSRTTFPARAEATHSASEP